MFVEPNPGSSTNLVILSEASKHLEFQSVATLFSRPQYHLVFRNYEEIPSCLAINRTGTVTLWEVSTELEENTKSHQKHQSMLQRKQQESSSMTTLNSTLEVPGLA